MLAVKLSHAGQDVAIVDRGLHLEAIRNNGLRLQMADGSQSVATNLQCADQIEEVGLADLVIVGVKAHQIADVAPDLHHLYGPETMVLTIQNGIPWWYFQNHGGALEGTRLQKLDCEGVITAHIPAERILGCVAYPASELTSPGVVHHIEGNRFPVGELDGSISRRATRVSEMFLSAGFKSFVLEDIRQEIWLKAWGALAFNTVSALTQATMVDICQFPETRELAANMMREAQVIAGKIGISFRHTIEKRIAGAEAVGGHKTSMLQDLQAGRALEYEAIIGSIAELAHMTNTPCPAINTVYACVKLLDHTMQQSGLALDGKPITHKDVEDPHSGESCCETLQS
jgi:2-dehydropantoate 2-reductase